MDSPLSTKVIGAFSLRVVRLYAFCDLITHGSSLALHFHSCIDFYLQKGNAESYFQMIKIIQFYSKNSSHCFDRINSSVMSEQSSRFSVHMSLPIYHVRKTPSILTKYGFYSCRSKMKTYRASLWDKKKYGLHYHNLCRSVSMKHV